MDFPIFSTSFNTSPVVLQRNAPKEEPPVRAGAPGRSAPDLAAAALQRLRAGRMRAAGAADDPGIGGGLAGGVLHRNLEDF